MVWWKIWDSDGRRRRGQPDFYEEGVELVQQALYHEALTSFRLSLKYNPRHPATLEQMAVVYTHIGLTDDAVRAYVAALEERPRSTAAHYGWRSAVEEGGERRLAALQEFLHTRAGTGRNRHLEPPAHLQRLGVPSRN